MAVNIWEVSTAQKKQGWDVKFRQQVLPKDIMGDERVANGVARDRALPSTSFMSKLKAESGESKRTISLLKELTGTGVSGSNARNLLGQEEKQATQERWVFSEELAHGVPAELYGKAAFEKDPYSIYGQAVPQLSRWHSRKRGTRIRQAICEGYDLLITGTDNQNGLSTSSLYPHRNVFVAKATDVTAQVSYSSTAATYGGSIYTAANGVVADITGLGFFDDLSSKLVNAGINPIEGQDERSMWIYVVPQRTANILRPLIRAVNQYTSGEKALKGELARVGNFILVEDNLAPRITTAAGTAAAFTYADPVSDGRTAASSSVHDVGMVLGAGALVEFEQEAAHIEYESQKYGRFKAVGSFTNYGINRMDWDDAANTNSANRKNYSSALVIHKAA